MVSLYNKTDVLDISFGTKTLTKLTWRSVDLSISPFVIFVTKPKTYKLLLWYNMNYPLRRCCKSSGSELVLYNLHKLHKKYQGTLCKTLSKFLKCALRTQDIMKCSFEYNMVFNIVAPPIIMSHKLPCKLVTDILKYIEVIYPSLPNFSSFSPLTSSPPFCHTNDKGKPRLVQG